jgi:hypothetical protein
VALLTNPCEGTDGTTVTTGNSDDNGGNAFVLVNIGAAAIMAYETTGAIHGTSSIRMTTPTTTSTVQVGWTDTGATSAAARWYVHFTTLPTALLQLGVNFRGNGAGSSLARIDTTTDGTFRCVMGSTTGSFSGSGLSTGTTYRLEAVASGFNGSSGTITVTAYVGESTTPFTSATVSGATTSFTCDAVRIGKFALTGNFDALWDSLAVNIGASSEIGPHARTGAVTETVTAGSTVTGVTGKVGAVTDTVTAGSTVSGAVGAVGAVTSTVTAGSGVVAVVGAVGAVTRTATAGSTVTGSVAAGGVTGEVDSTVTAGSTVTAVVGRVGAVADTITAGSTVEAAVAASGDVSRTLTAGSEVVAVVGKVGAVEATITVDADVSFGEPPSTGQATGRDRVTAAGSDRIRSTAHGAARERATATGSGR